MGKLCKSLFNYETEDAAKAFCIGEMLMGYVHCLVSICVVRLCACSYLDSRLKFDVGQWILFITYMYLMVGLIVQAICGILLYIIGYRKRNVTVCYVWMYVALINYLMPLVLLFTGFATKDLSKIYVPESVGWVLLYLLYLDFGFAAVGDFIKALKAEAKENATTTDENVEAGLSAKASSANNMASTEEVIESKTKLTKS